MQKRINEVMDNARDNGYDELNTPSLEIAEDIVTYSAEFENEEPETLVPYIDQWKARL